MDPIHFTMLKHIAKSPAHYLEALKSDRQTPAMRLGSAFHSYVLGGDQPVVFDGARRGKEWERFKAEHEGAEIITVDERDTACRMADAVGANRDAMQALDGDREVSLEWHYLDRLCSSRIDVLGAGHAHITELKSCACSDPMRFQWQAIKLAYHAQLAFYSEAAASVYPGLGKPKAAYIVAVESSAPYVVTVLRLTERALDQGARLCRLWFERLLGCEKWDVWPGYVESIVDLDVPDDEDVPLVFGDAVEAA